MSGFHTHMLIGAVSGLAVYDLAERFDPSLLPAGVNLAGASVPIPALAIGLTCVGVSSVASLWPDLDKPDSFITHAATHLMWLAGGLFGLLVGLQATQDLLWGALGAVLGAVIGLVAGRPLLGVLRVASFGHRRLTHSVLVMFGLVFGAGLLYLLHWVWLSLLLATLAWGLFLHLVGDVVTPGGVALFFPIWPGDIHLFPFWFSSFGEVMVAIISLLVGIFLIWFWRAI